MGNHTFDLSPGRVITYPHPINAQILTTPGENWHRIWIRSFGSFSYQAFQSLIGHDRFLLEIDPGSEPVELARKWAREWELARQTPSCRGSNQAYTWLLSNYELISRGEYTIIKTPNLYQYLSPNIHREFSTISEYSHRFGHSRSYMSQKLSKMWGSHEPAQILRAQRLVQAAQALKNQRTPITRIAREAHYAHTSSFIHAFKKEYGMTPLQYRYLSTN